MTQTAKGKIGFIIDKLVTIYTFPMNYAEMTGLPSRVLAEE